jgi:hypothetical protein
MDQENNMIEQKNVFDFILLSNILDITTLEFIPKSTDQAKL